jgi:inorganic pyrophosphatase
MNFIQKFKKFDIQRYKTPKDYKSISKTHVPFTGSPQRHPYDKHKILIISDPFSTNTHYYEFLTKNIDFVEELPSMVTLEGDTVSMARVWVKKKSVGIRCTPFLVHEIKSSFEPI